jgi:NTP pyrophosphatase (non-canonical NTP hydrolase)
MDADAATREHGKAWLEGRERHLGEDLDEMDRKLDVTCQWIDESPANASRDPEARTWGRLSKVAEEAGEVISAFIGVTGQNPRKGVSDTMDHVVEELLDVAVTALVAYVHVRPGESPMRAFEAHLDSRMKRVDLT